VRPIDAQMNGLRVLRRVAQESRAHSMRREKRTANPANTSVRSRQSYHSSSGSPLRARSTTISARSIGSRQP
jgi:hypothetical protein